MIPDDLARQPLGDRLERRRGEGVRDERERGMHRLAQAIGGDREALLVRDQVDVLEVLGLVGGVAHRVREGDHRPEQRHEQRDDPSGPAADGLGGP